MITSESTAEDSANQETDVTTENAMITSNRPAPDHGQEA